MKVLVGYTGFVGGNLAKYGKFDKLYNSKNIEEAFGTNPDFLVYAGVTAAKFLANKFPEKDKEVILNAFENIKKINPKKLVLISTIDVYEKPNKVTEEDIDFSNETYGKNRALLEQLVREEFPECTIVRLPALFGIGLKKNFIYDYLNYIPALLNETKFTELSKKNIRLNRYYKKNENGFYECKKLNNRERVRLKKIFEDLNFSALNFTDSRAKYQFYNLEHLYDDIRFATKQGIKLLNITSEPVSAAEIYAQLESASFTNEITDSPADYDERTLYFETFAGYKAADGIGGYLYNKNEILREIKKFTEEMK